MTSHGGVIYWPDLRSHGILRHRSEYEVLESGSAFMAKMPGGARLEQPASSISPVGSPAAAAVVPIDGLDQGILGIDLDLWVETAGLYAISAWLSEDRGFDSPSVRWPLTGSKPDRE